jgi:signal transduction histidine kinase
MDERIRIAREEERAQLSRMLHDDLAQSLTAAQMDLHWIARQVADPGNRQQALIDAVASISSRLSETIQAVQKISRELRSDFLTTGLIPALEAEVAAFERRSGIRGRLLVTGKEPLELDARTASSVFRIVQQALTNVVQHAGATRVNVAVRPSATGLTVSVADNGRGIPTAALSSRTSLGLIGMRERASLIGGRIAIHRRTPRGTIVRVIIPNGER